MQYYCNYCQEDIEDIRVRCFECSDFDLCLQCFSCGAEVGSHKNKHSYQLIDCGSFPIFHGDNGWKAQEELKLLDAVEQYGFGNWSDCARDLGKAEKEVETHYTDLYVHGNIGRNTWDVEQLPKVQDHTVQEEGQLSPSISSMHLPPIVLTSQEQQELGYLPNRDDFEKEYENDAECLVSNLVINSEDGNLDTAFKLAFISMYTNKIKERLERKKIAREHGLVTQFFNTSNKQKLPNVKKKSSKEERSCQERMLAFCRFQSGYEREQLAKNLQRERELKQRIKELYRCRKNGLAKLKDCADFEAARFKKEKKENGKLPVIFFAPKRLLMVLKEEEDENGDIISVERQKKDDILKQIVFGRHCSLFQLPNVLKEGKGGTFTRRAG